MITNSTIERMNRSDVSWFGTLNTTAADAGDRAGVLVLTDMRVNP
jgi:hypothetical protein